MKFKIDEFRISEAEAIQAPLDFSALCAALAAHQAGTPTARLARDGDAPPEHHDHANPAVAVLLGGPGQENTGMAGQGSFHAGAAARVSGGAR